MNIYIIYIHIWDVCCERVFKKNPSVRRYVFLVTMPILYTSRKMGDIQKGKKLFLQRCAACHNIEEGTKNKQGPNLYRLYGRKTGQASNFTYTDANKNRGK